MEIPVNPLILMDLYTCTLTVTVYGAQSCFSLMIQFKIHNTADNSKISCLCPCFLYKHYPQEVEHRELYQTNITLRFAHDLLKSHRNYNREKTTASSENFCVTTSPKPRQEFTQDSGVKIVVLNAQLTHFPLRVYRTRIMIL